MEEKKEGKMPYPSECVPASNSVDKCWEDTFVQSVMAETRQYLETRRAHDPKFTPEYLRRMLEELYQSEGDGWTGKEQLNELRQSATINAYELFLTEWEEEHPGAQ